MSDALQEEMAKLKAEPPEVSLQRHTTVPMEVRAVLARCLGQTCSKLDEYAHRLVSANWDTVENLLFLTEEDLQELGFTKPHIRRIIKGIEIGIKVNNIEAQLWPEVNEAQKNVTSTEEDAPAPAPAPAAGFSWIKDPADQRAVIDKYFRCKILVVHGHSGIPRDGLTVSCAEPKYFPVLSYTECGHIMWGNEVARILDQLNREGTVPGQFEGSFHTPRNSVRRGDVRLRSNDDASPNFRYDFVHPNTSYEVPTPKILGMTMALCTGSIGLQTGLLHLRS